MIQATTRWSVGAITVAAVFLLAGCRHPQSNAPPPAPSNVTAAPSIWDAETGDPALEGRIQAYAHFATGIGLEANDVSDKALEEFTRSALAAPEQEALVLDVARGHLQRQQAGRAVEVLRRAASRPQASGRIHAWLALAYGQSGKQAEALASYRTALARDPQLIMPYQGLTEASIKAGRWQEATKLLDRGARQSVAEPTYWTDLAELYLSCLRARGARLETIRPRALKALQKAAAQRPDNPAVRQRMAEQYKTLGDLAQAEKIYLELIEKYPSPLLRERLADVHLRNGKRELAVAQLEQIKRDLPTNPQVYFVLATLAAEEKLYPRAIELLDIALKLKPDFEPAWLELVSVRIAANQTAEALDVLERLRRQTKTSFVTEFYAGLVHSKAKDYPRAVERFAEAESLARAGETNRLTHLFYFQMGAACERAGDRARAEDLFRRSLALSPAFSEALNYLGYMWAERGERLTEAHQLIQRAVALEPNNAAFLDSLGWVLFKLGRPAAALKYLLEAVRHGEEPDATVHEHLGDVYAALKRFAEARQAYEKSLGIEAGAAVKKKLDALPAAAAGRRP